MTSKTSTAQPPAAPAKGTKKRAPAKSGKYPDLIKAAIRAQEEKKGSSIIAIRKHILAKDPSAKPIWILKSIRAMEKDGRLVPGAHAGKKGAGSFKLSPKMPVAGVAKKAKKVAKSLAIFLKPPCPGGGPWRGGAIFCHSHS